MPVVGETWDGVLNDVDGQHVTADHLREALADAAEARSRKVRSAAVRA